MTSTPFKSADPQQTGAKCDSPTVPKNCPDGYSLTFKDTGDCVCILSCAAIKVTVGQACNKAGTWTCQEIKNDSGTSSGKMCVSNSWKLCTVGGATSSSSSSGGSSSGGSSSGGSSSRWV